jgi:O-antigen/teichoic acid export membrane protein
MAEAEGRAVTDDRRRAMTLYGQTMTRTGAIFALGLVSVVPFGILSVAVTTRFLDPTEFGQLAILFAVASVVTMFCGVGFLQGTMIAVYGISEDGDDGGGADGLEMTAEEVELADVAARSDEQKRLLGSGLLIVFATSTALCVAVAAIGVVVAHLAFGGEWWISVLLMAASAWAGGLWRMMHQVPRMERMAVRWAWLQWIRPGLVVAGSIAALVAGLGIDGILAATAVATLLATAVAYFVSRRSFRYGFRRDDVGVIWRAGRAWVPLIFAVAIQTNVSILLLGLLATPASVGLFQVATRIAQFPIYFADGFVTAWPAMERSPISFAAKERKGVREYSASVFTLLALTTLGLLVFICFAADSLIHIAAPAYRDAASLIPIVAAAGAANVVFRGVFRATGFARRRYWYTFLHLVWIAPFAAVSALLVPWDASYGVAIAQVVAGVFISICFVLVDRRSRNPTPFEWKRLALAFLVAAACVAVVQLLPLEGTARPIASVLAFAAFPLLLLAVRAVPREDVSTVRAIAGAVLPAWRAKAEARERLATIPTHERQALLLIAANRQDPDKAATELGVTRPIALARTVRALRALANEEANPTPYDHEIGEYLVNRGPTIERDVLATRLRSAGIDPLELHVLEEAVGLARRLGRGRADEPVPAI